MLSSNAIIYQVTVDDLQSMIQQAVTEAMAGHRIAPTPDPGPRYLTGDEVCSLLRISKMTLFNWKAAGKLKSFKIGHRVLYLESDVDSAMTANVPIKYKRVKPSR